MMRPGTENGHREDSPFLPGPGGRHFAHSRFRSLPPLGPQRGRAAPAGPGRRRSRASSGREGAGGRARQLTEGVTLPAPPPPSSWVESLTAVGDQGEWNGRDTGGRHRPRGRPLTGAWEPGVESDRGPV